MRLAHAAHAQDGDKANVGRFEQTCQVAQFCVSPNERRHLSGKIASPCPRWRRRLLVGLLTGFDKNDDRIALSNHLLKHAVADVLHQRLRARIGCDTQFLVQDALTFLVLAQRRVALAGQRVHQHRLAMRLLVQRVQLQPAARRLDGPAQITLAGVDRHQPAQRAFLLSPLFLRGEIEPVVELRAVGHSSALQQTPAGQRDRVAQRRDAAGTDGVLSVAMDTSSRQ